MAKKKSTKQNRTKRQHSMIELQKNLRKYNHEKNVLKKRQANAVKADLERKRQRAIKSHRFSYEPDQHILLVGEGNCSFARSLIRKWRADIAYKLKRKGYPVPPEEHINKGIPIDFDLLRQLQHRRLHKSISDEKYKEMMENPEQYKTELKKLNAYDDADAGDDDDDDSTTASNHDEDEDDEDLDEDNEEFDEDDDQGDEDDELDEDDEELDEDDNIHTQTSMTDGTENDEDDEVIDYSNAVENSSSKLLKYSFRNVGRHLLVTCYDSITDAMKKYPDLGDILLELYSAGVRVVFDVDCTNMYKTLTAGELVPERKFDKIVFNFPHVGSGEKDREKNIAENQNLILKFMMNCLPLLRKPVSIKRISDNAQTKELQDAMEDNATHVFLRTKTNRKKATTATRGGEIIITIKTGEPYDSWHITKLARVFNHNQNAAQIQREDSQEVAPGTFALKYPRLAILRTETFYPEVYPGYSHRRTIGFKTGINDDNNAEIVKTGAKTYIFVRAAMGYVDKGLGISTEAAGGEALVVKRNVALKRQSKNKAIGGRKHTKSSRKRR